MYAFAGEVLLTSELKRMNWLYRKGKVGSMELQMSPYIERLEYRFGVLNRSGCLGN
ncbi:hypothetical protein [Peribacillus sp. NPDC096540]|uniref:hypothetical protein n=1 Tax=Peribacillus sp. NPDC096540 TaxID=3390612 RepID=UPI003D019124